MDDSKMIIRTMRKPDGQQPSGNAQQAWQGKHAGGTGDVMDVDTEDLFALPSEEEGNQPSPGNDSHHHQGRSAGSMGIVTAPPSLLESSGGLVDPQASLPAASSSRRGRTKGPQPAVEAPKSTSEVLADLYRRIESTKRKHEPSPTAAHQEPAPKQAKQAQNETVSATRAADPSQEPASAITEPERPDDYPFTTVKNPPRRPRCAVRLGHNSDSEIVGNPCFSSEGSPSNVQDERPTRSAKQGEASRAAPPDPATDLPAYSGTTNNERKRVRSSSDLQSGRQGTATKSLQAGKSSFQTGPKKFRRIWCAIQVDADESPNAIGNPYTRTGAAIDVKLAVNVDATGKPSLNVSFRISKDAISPVKYADCYSQEINWEPGVKINGRYMVEGFQCRGVNELLGASFPKYLHNLARNEKEFDKTFCIELVSSSPGKSSYNPAWANGLGTDDKNALHKLFLRPDSTPIFVKIWFVNPFGRPEWLEKDCIMWVRSAFRDQGLDVQPALDEVNPKNTACKWHVEERELAEARENLSPTKEWHLITEDEWSLIQVLRERATRS